jgi:DNA-binding CsgD family transcriptional regulator
MSEMRERIASLSPRQREVLLGVALQLSSKEIAVRLGLSPATVDSHIAAALQRLKLQSRRDAGLQMIQLGFVTGSSDSWGGLSSGVHHGGDQPRQSSPVARGWFGGIFRSSKSGRGGLFGGRGGGGRGGDGRRSRTIKQGMGWILVRYLFDAIYISLFFTVMSTAVLGVHWVVIQCEQRSVDPIVLYILKGVSYMLAGIDGVGVVIATGFLTYRFLRALVKIDG